MKASLEINKGDLRDYKWSLPDGSSIVVESDGSMHFYNPEGLAHREDGPARLWAENDVVGYYINGQLHREDGPALINSFCGIEGYYLFGVEYTEEEYKAKQGIA